MLKIIVTIFLSIILFLIVNKFLCSPSGTAPEIIDVRDIRITDFSAESLNLSVTATAVNKNNFEIDVTELSAKIVFKDDAIGVASREAQLTIAPLDTAEFTFTADLVTKKVLNLGSEEIDSIDLELIGSAKADLGIISLPVDVNLNHTFNLKDNISRIVQNDVKQHKILTIVNAKLNSLKPDNSAVEIEFNIKNPYDLEISVLNFPSQLYINDVEAGSGNIVERIIVQPGGKKTNGLMIYKLSNLKTLASLFGSILKRKIEYETKGLLSISVLGYEIRFPFTHKGDLIKI